MGITGSIFDKWQQTNLMLRILVGIIIGVIQDSVETALNSSGDVFFTIATDMRDRSNCDK